MNLPRTNSKVTTLEYIWKHLLIDFIQQSAGKLKTLSEEVNNTNHLVIVQCPAWKPWLR